MFLDPISQAFLVIGLMLVLLALFIGDELGLDFLMIGSILLLSGLVGLATGSVEITLLIATILSILYFFLIRRYVKRKLSKAGPLLNTDRLIGSQAQVIHKITPKNAGRVVIDDEEWRATSSHTLNVNSNVKVTNISGVTLVVEPT